MRTGMLFLLLCTGLCSAQDKPIKVDVRLVNVGFSVRNAQGSLVNDLEKEDFDVLEDAVQQKISFFAHSQDVPLTLGLIVDDSGSQDHFSKQHLHDLEVFLKEVLGPKDRAFLVYFGNHIKLVSDFSPSGTEILDKLTLYQHSSKGFPELGPKEKRELGTGFYDAIYYSIAEKLAPENGRRALLVFSDGEDNSSSHDMMTTIEEAQSDNVLVYTIRYTEKEHGHLTPRNQYGIRVMDRIAKETGGTAIDSAQTDPHNYFRQIADELRSSYELAYYPSDPHKDDTFRKIVIRAKQPGLNVRAKTGYFSR